MAKTTKANQGTAGPAKKKAVRKKKPAAKKKAAPAKKTATHQLSASRGAERRTEERHDINRTPKVDVALHGYHRDARELGIGAFPDTSRKIQTDGTTINLSLGGMLAHIADPITEGSHCLVRFVNAGANVRPELRWGLIIRCTKVEDGCYEVAMGFDSPLEVLDIDGLAA